MDNPHEIDRGNQGPSKWRNSGTWKWLLRAIRLLIVAVVLAFVAASLSRALQQWGEQQWHVRPGWLVLAAVLYLLGLLLAGAFWYHVLRKLGQEARLGETLRAYFIGHLGKYAPGKAMVVVLRAGLIRSHRVDTAVAAVSVFLETLTWIAVGGFLAAAYLAIHFRDKYPLMWGAVGVMLTVGLPTLPPLFRRLVRVAKAGKLSPEAAERLDRLGYPTLLLGWAVMPVSWALLGLSFWATLGALEVPGLDPVGELPRYSATVAMATVAGFAVLLVPGGLGTREGVLAELSVPYLQSLVPNANATAWAAVILLRLVWLVSELAISGILYVFGLRKPP